MDELRSMVAALVEMPFERWALVKDLDPPPASLDLMAGLAGLLGDAGWPQAVVEEAATVIMLGLDRMPFALVFERINSYVDHALWWVFLADLMPTPIESMLPVMLTASWVEDPGRLRLFLESVDNLGPSAAAALAESI